MEFLGKLRAGAFSCQVATVGGFLIVKWLHGQWPQLKPAITTGKDDPARQDARRSGRCDDGTLRERRAGRVRGAVQPV